MGERLSKFAPHEELNFYVAKVRALPMLAEGEEFILARRWREHGDRSANELLVTSHLRLVVKMAMKFRNYGFPVSDLIAEGNVGLIKAVNMYDPGKGFKLATYAMWWIRSMIQQYVLSSWSLVKIGTTADQKKLFFALRTLKSKISAFEEGDLTPAHVESLANSLGVDQSSIVAMNRRLGGDLSLNAPVGEEETHQWQDLLPDDSEDAMAVLERSEQFEYRSRALREVLRLFAPRERRILEARRLTEPPETLEELSREFGVSRERIRQIDVDCYERLQRLVRRRCMIEGQQHKALARNRSGAQEPLAICG